MKMGSQNEDLSSAVVGVTGTLIVVATVAVMVQMWARWKGVWQISCEDGLVLLSWASAITLATFCIKATRLGLGKHWSEFDMSNIKPLLEIFTILSIAYTLSMTFSKAAIASLYLRLLGHRSAHLALINRCLLIFFVCQAVEEVCVVALQCLPQVGDWGPRAQGSCLNLKSFWWATFSCNIATSILLFAQPLPWLSQQPTPWRDRPCLVFISCMGVVTICIISPIRQAAVSRIGQDITYDYPLPLIWSEVEIGTMILCACVPSFVDLCGHVSSRSSSPSSQDMIHSPPLPDNLAPRGYFDLRLPILSGLFTRRTPTRLTKEMEVPSSPSTTTAAARISQSLDRKIDIQITSPSTSPIDSRVFLEQLYVKKLPDPGGPQSVIEAAPVVWERENERDLSLQIQRRVSRRLSRKKSTSFGEAGMRTCGGDGVGRDSVVLVVGGEGSEGRTKETVDGNVRQAGSGVNACLPSGRDGILVTREIRTVVEKEGESELKREVEGMDQSSVFEEASMIARHVSEENEHGDAERGNFDELTTVGSSSEEVWSLESADLSFKSAKGQRDSCST